MTTNPPPPNKENSLLAAFKLIDLGVRYHVLSDLYDLAKGAATKGMYYPAAPLHRQVVSANPVSLARRYVDTSHRSLLVMLVLYQKG